MTMIGYLARIEYSAEDRLFVGSPHPASDRARRQLFHWHVLTGSDLLKVGKVAALSFFDHEAASWACSIRFSSMSMVIQSNCKANALPVDWVITTEVILSMALCRVCGCFSMS
jgi:hypothetical protein